MTKNDVIYESSDGGNTVWARTLGSTDRRLVSGREAINKIYRLEKWKLILEISETNQQLAEALEKVEVLYELVK